MESQLPGKQEEVGCSLRFIAILYLAFTEYIPFFSKCHITWSSPLVAKVDVLTMASKSLSQKSSCNSFISHSREFGMKSSHC